ncbi:MAG: glucose/galactose MFS transporter [Puniceicoccales bacterium]|jgi:glucose/galactose transporter|nr:glucose/galactose MFS transporter [Puniceicoccales bacterium]
MSQPASATGNAGNAATAGAATSANSAHQTGTQYLISISIIGALFFIFGFVTWLNGALIPFLKLACDLQTDAQALFVTFAFYMAYFVLALPAAAILARTGYKRGMAIGLAAMAAGAALCIPAAYGRSFGLFLTALFIIGTGLAFLQTASNPYISIIGPLESAAKRISIMGICNKTAGVIGAALFTVLLLGGAKDIEPQVVALGEKIVELNKTIATGTAKANAAVDAAGAAVEALATAKATLAEVEAKRAALLDALAQNVIKPYTVLAIILALLAIGVLFSPLPEIDVEKSNADDSAAAAGAAAGGSRKSIFSYPHLWLGVLCLFLYLGAEVMAGDAIGLYGKAMHVPTAKAGFLTSFTLGAMVVGYIGGIIAIPRFIKQERALAVCAVLGALFTAGAYLTGGSTLTLFGWLPVSVLFVALLGLANSVMWPAIFPLAIAGLGKFTNLGSAFLIMAIAGGALIPQFYARSQDWFHINFQLAFLICMLPCYCYVLYYALAGYKAGKAGRS